MATSSIDPTSGSGDGAVSVKTHSAYTDKEARPTNVATAQTAESDSSAERTLKASSGIIRFVNNTGQTINTDRVNLKYVSVQVEIGSSSGYSTKVVEVNYEPDGGEIELSKYGWDEDIPLYTDLDETFLSTVFFYHHTYLEFVDPENVLTNCAFDVILHYDDGTVLRDGTNIMAYDFVAPMNILSAPIPLAGSKDPNDRDKSNDDKDTPGDPGEPESWTSWYTEPYDMDNDPISSAVNSFYPEIIVYIGGKK